VLLASMDWEWPQNLSPLKTSKYSTFCGLTSHSLSRFTVLVVSGRVIFYLELVNTKEYLEETMDVMFS